MAHPRPESPHAPTVAASQWLSIDESGHYSGLSGRTLRRYVAEGVLPAYRVAGRRQLRFKRSDLDALMVPVPTVGGADA